MTSSMSMIMSGMASTTMSAASATAPAAAATSSGMSMDMGMGSGSSCKISMLWNWNTIDSCFLASSWHVKNEGMFAASCIGVAFLVVGLEFMRRVGKEYDTAILRQFQRHIAAQAAELKIQRSSDSCRTEPQFVTFRTTPLQQLIRSVIHAVTFGVAYIVMLLAMYFNGYIIISIIIGALIGKFLCDWMVQKVPIGAMVDNSKGHGVAEPTVCCG
ncbi:uncharacterized protein Z518_10271 [Rhinocladiella mackenziei CBS 650.93]|uniref:Copper transport protein n=1 Tax=Rhinocladiella mackenziei CBS 650.93 TaxID=1442369 RepID=A0A0D2I2Y2_9EURO|nr:uncharacterized protein Z518_10271 [Rhinocladiella mackenziei CBS 650.93]KIX00134.1 hypothetical protein Z518_10271 [Rhinocladiella mackenziei CBS 650.93]